ncbi:MAG: UDP-N-acetylglucosamine--LPS N-acetylglucosamine transferase [Paenibacillaceae bacterium]|nr:UDP-N-acetylglucosamine--LPS N-acetylglucosamine transferase [Paenibacillaceae bacterium]
MKQKRILFLSESFGTGHTQAALGLVARVHEQTDAVRTHVIELGNELHPHVFPLLCTMYKKTVCSLPHIYGLMYNVPHSGPLHHVSALALHRIVYRKTIDIITAIKPDAIVCTHPFPNMVLSRLKRAGSLSTPLITVITDYDVHGTWISHETTQYFVSTPEVRSKLLAHRIRSDAIRITGMPIHPKFHQHTDRLAILHALGLDSQRPTMLIMGGGWGLIDGQHLLGPLLPWCAHVQMIVVLGHRTPPHDAWNNRDFVHHPNVRIIGYTQDIDLLMEASDLLLTKPGGMTCAEADAKALPMVLYVPIRGQEQQNARHFVSKGRAMIMTSPAMLQDVCADVYAHIDAYRARRLTERRTKTPPPDDSVYALHQLMGS